MEWPKKGVGADSDSGSHTRVRGLPSGAILRIDWLKIAKVERDDRHLSVGELIKCFTVDDATASCPEQVGIHSSNQA